MESDFHFGPLTASAYKYGKYDKIYNSVGVVTTAEVTAIIIGTVCLIYSIARIARIADGVVYVLIEGDCRAVMGALV